jgi:hypothetical protein
MSTSNRRRSSTSIKILPPKSRTGRPLTLAEEDAQLRDRIYKLENTVAYNESYASNADSWRKGSGKRLPANAQARRKREFTQIAIEMLIGAIMVLGLLSFVWQRFMR